MTPKQALASALHLFIVAAFFFAGFFFISLAYLPELRELFFTHCTLIGSALLIAALALLIGFYALDRGRYLVIQMGVRADLSLIRETLEHCLSHQFPNKIFLNDVELGNKSQLQIQVSLAPLDEDAREELFIRAEKELAVLLRQRFGYSRPFHLVVKV